jgi:hypothetical protein
MGKEKIPKEEGRPTKYKEEYNDQAYKLCLLGATDKELADFFEVNEDTIYEWKKVHSKFSDSVKKGKVMADAEVAKSFHKRAVGYQYDEVTYEKLGEKLDGLEEEGDIKLEIYKKKIVTKELPPDAGAALNWLKNRQKDKWRDKQDVDLTSDGEKIEAVTIFHLPDNKRE